MEISVEKKTGLVRQYGDGLGDLEGCSIHELTAKELKAFQEHMAAGETVKYVKGQLKIVTG